MGLLILVAAAALVLGRGIGTPSAEFDEAVYLASARALTGGAELGQDVFASQPPLFFSFLEGSYWLFDGSDTAIRVLMLFATLGGAVAAWALVREIAGREAGLIGAGLFLVAPSIGERAAVISGDVPAVAFVVAAVAVATIAVPKRAEWALAAGVLGGAALMLKLLAAPLLPAVLVALWAVRAPIRAYVYAIAAAAAAVVVAVVPYLGSAGDLWEGAFGIRGGARDVFGPGVGGGTAILFIALGGLALAAVAGLVAAIGAPKNWWRERAAILAMVAGGLVFVFFHKPLFAHHLVVISAPLALLAASAWPRLRVQPAAALVAVVGIVLLLAPLPIRDREAPPPAFDDQERVAEIVRAETAPSDPVISDLPLVPILADRAPPPQTIDVSFVRMGSDPDAPAIVLAEAEDAGAVVAGRAFLASPGLVDQLAARFPESERVGDITVFYRGLPAGSST